MKIFEVITEKSQKFTVYAESKEDILDSGEFNKKTGKVSVINEITDNEVDLILHKSSEECFLQLPLDYLKKPETRLSEDFIECKEKVVW